MKTTMPACTHCFKDGGAVSLSEFPEDGTHYCEDCEKWFTPEEGLVNPGNQLTESVKDTYERCLSVLIKKNHDYAGAEGLYRNFETGLRIGIPVQASIMVRLLDKITRLENLMTTEPCVTEETFDDTIDDAINYLAILRARRQHEVTRKKP